MKRPTALSADRRWWQSGGTSRLDPYGRSMHDPGMAGKTITLDEEAYKLLARYRRADESFSTVIKEHFEKPTTGQDLLDVLPEISLSEETLDAIEGLVEARRADPARSVDL